MRVLAIIDPPEKLSPTGDSTVAILDELLLRGHEVAITEIQELYLRPEAARVLVGAEVRWVEAVDRRDRPALRLRGGDGQRQELGLDAFAVVLIRKDPPYDVRYHLATLILEHARGYTRLVNDPRGLREANEKLYIYHFPELLCPTVVERRMEQLRGFLQAQGGKVMVKLLDGYAGNGVFLLEEGDRNANMIMELMTDREARPVMAQRYLKEARAGDKRILLLDGDPVGVLLRIPDEKDHRSNLAVGGHGALGQLTEEDRQLCARLKPRLQRDGLYFVGIDVVGGYLTEVNVTSPTGIQAIDRLTGARVEATVVDWLEQHAEAPLPAAS